MKILHRKLLTKDERNFSFDHYLDSDRKFFHSGYQSYLAMPDRMLGLNSWLCWQRQARHGRCDSLCCLVLRRNFELTWLARIHLIEFLNIQLWHLSIDFNALASWLVNNNRISKSASQSSVVMHYWSFVIFSEVSIRSNPIVLFCFQFYVKNRQILNFKIK